MTGKGRVRVACVGAGYFSGFHRDAWSRIDRVDLVGTADADFAKAKATGLPAFASLRELLESVRPDIVDIITPPRTHLVSIGACLEAGVRTIICQKPFCGTLEEAREAARLASAANVPLVVHENFRFQPWYRVMKRAIGAGMIGDVHQITFRLRTGDGQGSDAYLARQPYFRAMERFLIHETGVHWVDVFRYLLGEPKQIYADLRRINPQIAGEDAGYFIMEFTGGARAVFDANRHLDHASRDCRITFGECLLEGTNGTITLSGDGSVWLRRFGQTTSEALLAADEGRGFAGDCVHAFQSHVVAALLDGAELENHAGDYLRVLELEAAIYRSNETGCRIDV